MATSIDTLVPGEWYLIPNSRLDQSGVYPPNPQPPPLTGVGPPAVMIAWNGGAMDTLRNRLYVHGGGHGDYSGNEIYAYNFGSLTWSRPFGPSSNAVIPSPAPVSPNIIQQYSDGNPVSVHTYCGFLYIPGIDKVFRCGGSLWSGGGDGSRASWIWNPVTAGWARQADDASLGVGPTYIYDPVTHSMYGFSDRGVFKRWNIATNTWSGFGSFQGQSAGDMGGMTIGEDMSVCFDPDTRIIVACGNSVMIVCNLNTGILTQPTSSGAGASAIVTKRGPGMAWDPVSRRIVAWWGGTTTYSLNSTTLVWTTNTASGANTVTPPTDPLNTTRLEGGFPFSKWQYLPSKNVFIVVNSVSGFVYAYRLTANPYPNRTWVSKPSPSAGQGPAPGGAAKHTRMCYDSRRSVIVNTGGDYQDSVASDNGNAHIWQRDIFNIPGNNSWTNKHGYCSLSGQLMPSAPDNVGFAYDSARDRYYTIPGFYNDLANIQPNCPGRTLTMNPVQFDPSGATPAYSAVTWSNPTNGYGGDLGATFAVYDPIGDRVYRFRDTGSLKMEILNVAAGTWSQVTAPNFPAPADNPNCHGDQSVIDVLGRAVYCYLRTTQQSTGYLLRFDINSSAFTRIAVPSSICNGLASTNNTDIETWMAFDPISRKILLPSYNAISYTGQVALLGIFDVDAQTWETETPNLSGININTIGFDAAAGVMLGFGRSSGSSAQFYYRYGGAAVAPGDTTSPSVSITAPANGATVSGTVSVTANASDNVGVVGVTFKVDGSDITVEDTSSPYSVSWNTNSVSNGAHVLTAVARDAAGNSTTSASINVTVNNLTLTSYTTTFPLTENPISEGGVWSHTPNQWTAVRTSGGNAFGTNGITDTYDDSYALLSGFPNDVEATCTLFRNPSGTFTVTHEVCLFMRGADTSNSIRGYEFLFAYFGEFQLMRWNGPFGDFTNLVTNGGIGRAFITGDVFRARVQGNVLTAWVNNIQIAQVTDTTYPSGQPGINFFLRPGGNGANFAMQDYSVSALTAPDITPPLVSISAPANGATVSGNVTVTANASDNVGVVGVQFKLDGANLGSEDTSSPYSITWNSLTASNGAHSLTAVARDAAGNTTTSTAISVTVNNLPAVPSPPTLSSPANAATGVSIAPTLVWQASAGAASYRVQVSTSSGFGSTVVDQAGITGTSQAISGLAIGTQYFWRVNATNAGGTSAFAAAFSFTTVAVTVPTPPRNLRIT